ncbi:MAG: DUF4303 domain-containing protein, partial [Jaaginema sp. PMC 1079.18]|nr:DUF4303 domain-containing protein [Jaaginema sp. PMC 1079.18]
NKILHDIPEKLDKVDTLEFDFTCQILDDILLTVLLELDSVGVFNESIDRNSIVVTIVENDPDLNSQLEIVKRLNPPEVYRKFKKELEFYFSPRSR